MTLMALEASRETSAAVTVAAAPHVLASASAHAITDLIVIVAPPANLVVFAAPDIRWRSYSRRSIPNKLAAISLEIGAGQQH
jgi:hypothetical protein